MVKKIALLLLFLNTINFFSQNQVYKVSYRVSEYKDFEKRDDIDKEDIYILKKIKKQISEYGKNLIVEVYCNTSDFYYKIPDRLEVDANKNPYYKKSVLSNLGLDENLLNKGDFFYYFHNSDKFVTKVENDVVDWQFTGNKKTINNIQCQELYPIFKDNINFGKKGKGLKVWVDINSNLKGGPLRFKNIPGFVVSIENQFVCYEMFKIEKTNKKIVSIEDFTDKKPVKTFEEALKYHKKIGNLIEQKSKS